MAADLDPLVRHEGEGRRANAALRDYAALGIVRSLRVLLAGYVTQAANANATKPPTVVWRTLSSWSQRHDWVARAAAYDTDLQAQARIAQIDAIREMATRQATQGQQFQAIARLLAERGEQYIRLLRAATVETIDEAGQVIRVIRTELTASEVANLLRAAAALAKVGIDAERLARGEATERVDVFARVRELAHELGLTAGEEAEAVAAAERIVRKEI